MMGPGFGAEVGAQTMRLIGCLVMVALFVGLFAGILIQWKVG